MNFPPWKPRHACVELEGAARDLLEVLDTERQGRMQSPSFSLRVAIDEKSAVLRKALEAFE